MNYAPPVKGERVPEAASMLPADAPARLVTDGIGRRWIESSTSPDRVYYAPAWVFKLVESAERDGFIGNEMVRDLLTELEKDGTSYDPEQIDLLVQQLRLIPALAR